MNEVIRAALADVFQSINSLTPEAFAENLKQYEGSEFALSLEQLNSFFLQPTFFGLLRRRHESIQFFNDIQYSAGVYLHARNDNSYALAA